MSSCLSGGGRAYRLNLEIVKSPSTSWTSNASSPSSTLSESSNSSFTISTRKPRTPRKRPNQTYNEAAALLSIAYPKIFSRKNLTKPWKSTKQQYPFSSESSDLLQPFGVVDNSSFLINPPTLENPGHPGDKKLISCEKPCLSPGEINSKGKSLEFSDDLQDDFDAESILDEEIEEGIDSILGNSGANNEFHDESNACCYGSTQVGTCYGYPVGLGFGVNFDYNSGMRNSISPFRNVNEGDWWRFPSVNVRDITPKFNKPSTEKKKKKKKQEKPVELLKNSPFAKANSIPSRANKDNSAQKDVAKEELNNTRPNAGLLLKLNCNDVLTAWSDRGLPFSEDSPVAEAAGNDINVMYVSQIPPGK